MGANYVPDAGDIVWLDSSPQAGREQAGRRPAVVLSARRYNQKTGLMICCPATTRINLYPFEVKLSGDSGSVVLADHVYSADWRARGALLKAICTQAELAEIRGKLRALIF